MEKLKAKNSFSAFIKATALAVCFCMLVGEGALYANTPRPVFTPISAEALAIPERFGTVDESYRAPAGSSSKDKTIIYIQDAHDSLEAQENIAKMIQHLVHHTKVQTVFEEGDEGLVSYDELFRSIPERDIKARTSYFLMDKLRINGAEFAHINRGKNFKLVGADSLNLYLANLDWYKSAAKEQKVIAENIQWMKREVEMLAQKFLSKDAKDFLKLKKRYQQNQINIVEYIKRIKKLANLRVNELENSFVNSLTRKLANFDYPILELILNADETTDVSSMDPKQIFVELNQLVEDVETKLFTKSRDLQIAEYLDAIELFSRLNKIEITATEYEEAREKIEALKTQNVAQFIAKHAEKSVVLPKSWESLIESAIKFYEYAYRRDAAIAGALEEYLAKDEEVSVLVFGGFHKEGIKEILKEQGYSYHIVTPKITEISERHQEYYKTLMAEGFHDYELSELVARAAAQLRLLPAIKTSRIHNAQQSLDFIADVLRTSPTSSRDFVLTPAKLEDAWQKGQQLAEVKRSEARDPDSEESWWSDVMRANVNFLKQTVSRPSQWSSSDYWDLNHFELFEEVGNWQLPVWRHSSGIKVKVGFTLAPDVLKELMEAQEYLPVAPVIEVSSQPSQGDFYRYLEHYLDYYGYQDANEIFLKLRADSKKDQRTALEIFKNYLEAFQSLRKAGFVHRDPYFHNAQYHPEDKTIRFIDFKSLKRAEDSQAMGFAWLRIFYETNRMNEKFGWDLPKIQDVGSLLLKIETLLTDLNNEDDPTTLRSEARSEFEEELEDALREYDRLTLKASMTGSEQSRSNQRSQLIEVHRLLQANSHHIPRSLRELKKRIKHGQAFIAHQSDRTDLYVVWEKEPGKFDMEVYRHKSQPLHQVQPRKFDPYIFMSGNDGIQFTLVPEQERFLRFADRLAAAQVRTMRRFDPASEEEEIKEPSKPSFWDLLKFKKDSPPTLRLFTDDEDDTTHRSEARGVKLIYPSEMFTAGKWRQETTTQGDKVIYFKATVQGKEEEFRLQKMSSSNYVQPTAMNQLPNRYFDTSKFARELQGRRNLIGYTIRNSKGILKAYQLALPETDYRIGSDPKSLYLIAASTHPDYARAGFASFLLASVLQDAYDQDYRRAYAIVEPWGRKSKVDVLLRRLGGKTTSVREPRFGMDAMGTSAERAAENRKFDKEVGRINALKKNASQEKAFKKLFRENPGLNQRIDFNFEDRPAISRAMRTRFEDLHRSEVRGDGIGRSPELQVLFDRQAELEAQVKDGFAKVEVLRGQEHFLSYLEAVREVKEIGKALKEMEENLQKMRLGKASATALQRKQAHWEQVKVAVSRELRNEVVLVHVVAVALGVVVVGGFGEKLNLNLAEIWTAIKLMFVIGNVAAILLRLGQVVLARVKVIKVPGVEQEDIDEMAQGEVTESQKGDSQTKQRSEARGMGPDKAAFQEPIQLPELPAIEDYFHYLFYKPINTLSSLPDSSKDLRPTIFDLIENETGLRYGEYDVSGRLDFDVSGLLIVSNNPYLNDLMNPETHVEKTYEVVVKGLVKEEDVEILRKGGGVITTVSRRLNEPAPHTLAPARVEIISAKNKQSVLRLHITEGVWHQVKLMMELIGHPILKKRIKKDGPLETKLRRVGFGDLELPANLEPGQLMPMNGTQLEKFKLMQEKATKDLEAEILKDPYRFVRRFLRFQREEPSPRAAKALHRISDLLNNEKTKEESISALVSLVLSEHDSVRKYAIRFLFTVLPDNPQQVYKALIARHFNVKTKKDQDFIEEILDVVFEKTEKVIHERILTDLASQPKFKTKQAQVFLARKLKVRSEMREEKLGVAENGFHINVWREMTEAQKKDSRVLELLESWPKRPDWLESDRGNAFFVYQGERPVGVIAFDDHPLGEGREIVDDGLFIHPDFRGRGLGEKLVNTLIRSLKGNGFKRYITGINETEESRGFWHKFIKGKEAIREFPIEHESVETLLVFDLEKYEMPAAEDSLSDSKESKRSEAREDSEEVDHDQFDESHSTDSELADIEDETEKVTNTMRREKLSWEIIRNVRRNPGYLQLVFRFDERAYLLINRKGKELTFEINAEFNPLLEILKKNGVRGVVVSPALMATWAQVRENAEHPDFVDWKRLKENGMIELARVLKASMTSKQYGHLSRSNPTVGKPWMFGPRYSTPKDARVFDVKPSEIKKSEGLVVPTNETFDMNLSEGEVLIREFLKPYGSNLRGIDIGARTSKFMKQLMEVSGGILSQGLELERFEIRDADAEVLEPSSLARALEFMNQMIGRNALRIARERKYRNTFDVVTINGPEPWQRENYVEEAVTLVKPTGVILLRIQKSEEVRHIPSFKAEFESLGFEVSILDAPPQDYPDTRFTLDSKLLVISRSKTGSAESDFRSEAREVTEQKEGSKKEIKFLGIDITQTWFLRATAFVVFAFFGLTFVHASQLFTEYGINRLGYGITLHSYSNGFMLLLLAAQMAHQLKKKGELSGRTFFKAFFFRNWFYWTFTPEEVAVFKQMKLRDKVAFVLNSLQGQFVGTILFMYGLSSGMQPGIFSLVITSGFGIGYAVGAYVFGSLLKIKGEQFRMSQGWGVLLALTSAVVALAYQQGDLTVVNFIRSLTRPGGAQAVTLGFLGGIVQPLIQKYLLRVANREDPEFQARMRKHLPFMMTKFGYLFGWNLMMGLLLIGSLGYAAILPQFLQTEVLDLMADSGGRPFGFFITHPLIPRLSFIFSSVWIVIYLLNKRLSYSEVVMFRGSAPVFTFLWQSLIQSVPFTLIHGVTSLMTALSVWLVAHREKATEEVEEDEPSVPSKVVLHKIDEETFDSVSELIEWAAEYDAEGGIVISEIQVDESLQRALNLSGSVVPLAEPVADRLLTWKEVFETAATNKEIFAEIYQLDGSYRLTLSLRRSEARVEDAIAKMKEARELLVTEKIDRATWPGKFLNIAFTTIETTIRADQKRAQGFQLSEHEINRTLDEVAEWKETLGALAERFEKILLDTKSLLRSEAREKKTTSKNAVQFVELDEFLQILVQNKKLSERNYKILQFFHSPIRDESEGFVEGITIAYARRLYSSIVETLAQQMDIQQTLPGEPSQKYLLSEKGVERLKKKVDEFGTRAAREALGLSVQNQTTSLARPRNGLSRGEGARHSIRSEAQETSDKNKGSFSEVVQNNEVEENRRLARGQVITRPTGKSTLPRTPSQGEGLNEPEANPSPRDGVRSEFELTKKAVFVITAEELEALTYDEAAEHDQFRELLGIKRLNDENLHVVILGDTSKLSQRAWDLKQQFKHVHFGWTRAVPTRDTAILHFGKAVNWNLFGETLTQELKETIVSFNIFDGAFLAGLSFANDDRDISVEAKKKQAIESSIGMLTRLFQAYAIVASSA